MKTIVALTLLLSLFLSNSSTPARSISLPVGISQQDPVPPAILKCSIKCKGCAAAHWQKIIFKRKAQLQTFKVESYKAIDGRRVLQNGQKSSNHWNFRHFYTYSRVVNPICNFSSLTTGYFGDRFRVKSYI